MPIKCFNYCFPYLFYVFRISIPCLIYKTSFYKVKFRYVLNYTKLQWWFISICIVLLVLMKKSVIVGLPLKEKWEEFGIRLDHAQQQMKMTENALVFAFVEVIFLLMLPCLKNNGCRIFYSGYGCTF